MSDHTNGFHTGQPTPVGHVADNDYAIGQFIERLSGSPIWNQSAVFIIEDDAQDGPDHVDCHRSTAYVISPWIKANAVDHTFYNTDSVLHSIELILGLPPMSQYDAGATPILDFDTAANNQFPGGVYAPQQSAFVAQTAAKTLPRNSPLWKLAKMTAGMDFTKEDKAPPQLLNQVIWESVKGVNSPMPAPQHHVVLTAAKGKAAGKAPAQPADND